MNQQEKETATNLQPECSIYEYILKHTYDGRLPDDFTIPWISGNWAPGAKDGTFLYHMMPAELDSAAEQKILDALMMMSGEESSQYTDEIFRIFEELDSDFLIVRLFDDIARIFNTHKEALNLENILNYGDWLISYGLSLLSVKLGLSLLALFKVPFVEEVMTEFGVYDEFTYYSARVLSHESRSNGNKNLFNLAKNVKGWGRIHAVEYLQPTTQEIRDWLLFEGSNNVIHSQYSADICLQKSGAKQRLYSTPSAEEYEAIGDLIQIALESDGPRPGITEGEVIIPRYLELADKYDINPALRGLIQNYGENISASDYDDSLKRKPVLSLDGKDEGPQSKRTQASNPKHNEELKELKEKKATLPMCLWTAICIASPFVVFSSGFGTNERNAILMGLIISAIPLISLMIPSDLELGKVGDFIIGLLTAFAIAICGGMPIIICMMNSNMLNSESTAAGWLYFLFIALMFCSIVIVGKSVFRLPAESANKRMIVIITALLIMLLGLLFKEKINQFFPDDGMSQYMPDNSVVASQGDKRNDFNNTSKEDLLELLNKNDMGGLKV